MITSFPFNGNLTADPKFIPAEGDKKARLLFSVATTTNRGRENEKTEFWDLQAYGSIAENASKTLKKGSAVVGEARLRTYKREFNIKGEDKLINQLALTATRLGVDLTFATATVTKNPSKGAAEAFDPDEETAEVKAAAKAAPAKAAPKAAPAPAAADEDDDF
jgi:single-stranded DNA-binding protein